MPRQQKGNNDKSNLVVCSQRDHILAHYCRYMCYGNAWDLLAVKCMNGQTEDLCHVMGKMRADQTRRDGTHFFSPAWQKKYNFKRWGVKIAGKLTAYENLHPRFIAYHKQRYEKTSYSQEEYDQIIQDASLDS